MARNNENASVETLGNSEAFFLKYKKAIIGVVVAVVIIVVGAIIYNNYYVGPHENEASTALAKGQEYFAAELYEQALNGNKSGFAGFLGIASDYSGTDAGNLANLYAGLCYARLDKWNEAVTYLEKYSPSDDQMISPAATAALGDAYAHTDNLDKAVEQYKKAAKMADAVAADGANNSLSPTFLIKAGEILESQGKKDEALEIYKSVKTKYINSSASREIDKYIQRASI